jgi:sterol desaturase/sphingolipid hydroxylase (fatty acid hydroxylase superfamily)
MIDTLTWLTIGLIPAFILLDWAVRGRKHASTRFWRLRATAVTVANFFISGYVATFWGSLLGDFQLFDLSGLGTSGGLAVGVLVYELGHYWYHRMAHSHDWLWRLGHQMHHSAESLDVFGAYWLHPLDNFMFTSISSLVFFPLLGVTLEAGVLSALFLTFNALFQHASLHAALAGPHPAPGKSHVHSPPGIYRHTTPTSHVDMVFGTFRNPEGFQPRHGFYDGASERIGEMLAFRDVSTPKRAPVVAGQVAVP